ncbi:MAG: polysaccharide deacetylase family protein [bacterium]|nr:polysaccharide deacetylase family protein [bacterium]
MKVYNHGKREVNQVAITFDDGPGPCTEEILDILRFYDVKVTFFVLGKWAEKYPDIVRRVVREGHSIGNHTYSHLSRWLRKGDFKRAEGVISSIIGESTRFIRAPYFNTIGCRGYYPIKQGLVKIVGADVEPKDWKNKAEDIQKIVKEETKNGSILVLHDGSEKWKELKSRPLEMTRALPGILEFLKSEFNLVRLEEFIF